MKILVTGGAGFIGSHVCDALLAKGHEVLALDDLSSGRRDNLDPRVKLHVLDIRSPEAARLVLDERPQALYHLAAQMDVRRSVADPRFDAEVNLGGFLNLLEAVAKAGTRRVVFSSTGGAIYGEQDVFPAPESHPQRPCSPYGVSKASGELYLGYYRQQYGLSYAALRYANVYGPRQNPHGEAGVVAIFCDRILSERDCTIYGDGGQTRDFVYVADVARANVLALEADYVGAVNIGTGVETDVNVLYERLAEAAKTSRKAVHAEAKPGEQRRSCISPALAAKILGWKPEVSLADGLGRTYAFFAERSRTRAS
ncbi:MAG: NAD-dependent epimerase/dehydratase family protein [Deltaproteobacteria bacterium]|nr:NAD-dependent epimerase/dehydratase family protein [Deltaproteobacteria bacterium]